MRRAFASVPLFIALVLGPVWADDAPAPYLAPGQIDVLSLIPPPPPPGSPQAKRDLDAVFAVQRKRSSSDIRVAAAYAEVSAASFADAIGPGFTAEKAPLAFKLLTHIARERSALSNLLKDCYKRDRPFVVSGAVHALAEPKKSSEWDPKRPVPTLAAGVAERCIPNPPTPPAYSWAYPSGHASFGALLAIELAAMVPERRDEIFARGWDIGWGRLVGGVHYPSDLEAGHLLAALVAAELSQSARFRADFEAAKKELRAALGLAN